MRKALLLMFLLVIVPGLLAQSRHRKRQHQAPPQPQMPSAKQSEEMKKMTDTFVGMWKTTTTVEKSDLFSLSGTSNGHSDFRSGPAGNSLIERTRSHGVLGVFAGMGVFWWDAQKAAYSALWCDSLAPDGCMNLGRGQWDGNALVFTSVMDMGPNKMHVKSTYSNISTDAFTYTLEAGMDGAPLAKVMTVQYERTESKTVMEPPPTAPATAAAPAATPEAPAETAPKPQ